MIEASPTRPRLPSLLRRLNSVPGGWALAYSVFAIVLIAVYFLLDEGTWTAVIYPLGGFSAMLAIVAGTFIHRPERRRAWLLIAAGIGLFSCGDAAYSIYGHFGEVPMPSLADTFYLSGYVLLAGGIIGLMTQQRGSSRLLGILDTAIITTAAGAYIWVFMIEPSAIAAGEGLLAELVGGAYPFMDLVLMAFLVRLLLGGAFSKRSLLLLGAGMLLLFVTDTGFYAWCQPHDKFIDHSYPDLGWLLSYLLCGAAGLHRSMRASPPPIKVEHVSPLRLGALAASLLSGPAILMIELGGTDHRRYAIELAVPLTFLLLLVFGRLAFGIFEQRDLLREVAKSESHYRSLAENAFDVVSVIDADWRYIYSSPSIERVLGYTPTERLGASMLDFLDESAAAHVREALASLPEGETVSFLARVRHKDGRLRTLDCSFRSLLNDPAVQGIVVNGRDVTESRRVEAQLVQAQKMEAVGQLAGGVAHDFNNVLQAISGATELALTAPGEWDEAERSLLEIQEAARLGAAISRQLLDFSRGDSEQPRLVDVDAVIEGVSDMVRRLLGSEVQLELDASAGLPPVLIDPTHLEQVIMNMATNARDAMPRGGRLAISLQSALPARLSQHQALAPGDYAELAFADCGQGMDEETAARIFEPFYTTKEVGKGTGLGLAISYGIVHRAGGAIDVESRPGAGTVFRVLLPLSAPSVVAPTPL